MTQARVFRDCKGILADSAVGLWLVVGGMVFGALLLLNAGGFTYYKIRLGFIANSVATYACKLPSNAARNGLVTTFANQTLQTMGFNPSNVTVTISDTTIVTRPAVKVTISASLSTLLSNNFAAVIPKEVTLSDTAVAAQKYWYWGDGELLNPAGGHCTFPLVNGTGALPADGLPAYECTLFKCTKIR